MKIDFLISKMSDGGAQRVVSILANYLDNRGYKIRIITFYGDDHYELNPGINRIRLHRKNGLPYVVFNGFVNLIQFYFKKSNRPDIISSHIDALGYVTIPIARLYGIPLIVSEHNNYLSRYTLKERFLWNILYPYANVVTILTSFDLEYFKKKNRNTHIMPNPYSFEPKKTITGIANRKKEIMTIGDLDRYHHKGFDNLLEIYAQVKEKFPDWPLIFVGRGEHGKKYLVERIQELGLEDNVQFLGFRTDIQNLLSNTGIYILSSRYEGLPMTLLEAISQGAPSIAYDCISGPSDIIDHEINGILIENQNKQKMIDGLVALISQPGLRSRLEENGPISLKKFDILEIGPKWEDLFRSLNK